MTACQEQMGVSSWACTVWPITLAARERSGPKVKACMPGLQVKIWVARPALHGHLAVNLLMSKTLDQKHSLFGRATTPRQLTVSDIRPFPNSPSAKSCYTSPALCTGYPIKCMQPHAVPALPLFSPGSLHAVHPAVHSTVE